MSLHLYVSHAQGLTKPKRDLLGMSEKYVRVKLVDKTTSGRVWMRSDLSQTEGQRSKTKSCDPTFNYYVCFNVPNDDFSVILDVCFSSMTGGGVLGRQYLHFHASECTPHLSEFPDIDPRHAAIERIETEMKHFGQKSELKLVDEHDTSVLRSHMDMQHVRSIFVEEDGKQSSRKVTGTLTAYYLFVNSSSPSQSQSSSSSRLSLSEQGHEEDGQLPEGWEQRTDFNGRQMFINHRSRQVSIRRPFGTATQPTGNRQYLPRQNTFELSMTSDDINPPLAPILLPQSPQGTAAVQTIEPQQYPIPSQYPSTAESSVPVQYSVPPPSQYPISPPSQYPISTPPSTAIVTDAGNENNTANSAPSAPPIEDVEDQNEITMITDCDPEETLPNVELTSTNTSGATVPNEGHVGEGQPNAPPIQDAEDETTNHTSDTSQPDNVHVASNLGTSISQNSDLPPGWEMKRTNDGRVYYRDNNTKTTTWTKPVSPQHIVGSITSAAEQDQDLPAGWEVRKNKDGCVYYVDHNTKTTTWDHPLKKATKGSGPLPPGWVKKLAADGRVFYLDHNTKSTQWEDPRLLNNKPVPKMEYSRDYQQKLTNFRRKLPGILNEIIKLKITVHRDKVLDDSYHFISLISNEQLRLPTEVIFEGEKGIDCGGLSREWFHLLSKEMFNPYYGLFEYAASDDYTLQISPNSGLCNANHLDYFKFYGRVCGMAIYNNMIIDAFFIRPFYKMMLGKKVTLEDMQSVDVEMYNSLKYILENDPEPLCLNFSVNKEVLGELKEVDLKHDGKNISVTEKNKKEYVDLMIKWRFTSQVQNQMDAFMKGFSDVISPSLIQVFDERELEYLMGGLLEIDVEDWKKNTEYDGYTANNNVIVWFWKAVSYYDNEMRARLLQFVTGTSKVPMNGFAELQGSQGSRKFCIKRYGAVNSFPRAHTCFNRLDLPPYTEYYQLKEKLTTAIENTEGFSGVD